LGYRVEQTPFSNDGGKDAIAWKDGKKFLIECKRYRGANTIGERDLKIFVASMQDEKADGGFYINTGVFTKDATDYGRTHNVRLYDRDKFRSLVDQAFPQSIDFSTAKVICLQCGSITSMPVEETRTSGICSNGHTITSNICRGELGLSLAYSSTDVPDCEKCGFPMKKVHGRRGLFWGCSHYPKCSSTKPII